MPTASPRAISWKTASSASRHMRMSSTLATSALLRSSMASPWVWIERCAGKGTRRPHHRHSMTVTGIKPRPLAACCRPAVAPLPLKPRSCSRGRRACSRFFRLRQKGELDQRAYEEHLTRSVAEVCNSYGEPDAARFALTLRCGARASLGLEVGGPAYPGPFPGLKGDPRRKFFRRGADRLIAKL